MKGFNPAAAFINDVRKFMTEVRESLGYLVAVVKEHSAILKEHSAILDQVLKTQEKHTEMLEFLVAELSRFKNDSDSLLVSIFAYCHITGYVASAGEMKHMGKLATRRSRKLGYKMSKTQDPRFGEVGLYDPELLRDLFPVEDTED